LAALAAVNLVRLEPDTAVGDMRVGMMETVRAYAAELLETSGEAEAVRRRHLTWSVELAEAAEPHLKDQNQTMWLTRLRTEHHNLQAALHWARDTAAYAEGLRLAVVLGYLFLERPRPMERGRALARRFAGVQRGCRSAAACPGSQ